MQWHILEQRTPAAPLTLHAWCLQTIHVCLDAGTWIWGWFCFCACVRACAPVRLYPCLSGDITLEVSDAPGASNKGDKKRCGYMWPDSFTLWHTHTHTHSHKYSHTNTHTQGERNKEREADRHVQWIHSGLFLLFEHHADCVLQKLDGVVLSVSCVQHRFLFWIVSRAEMDHESFWIACVFCSTVVF